MKTSDPPLTHDLYSREAADQQMRKALEYVLGRAVGVDEAHAALGRAVADASGAPADRADTEAIRARLDAITPWPWAWDHSGVWSVAESCMCGPVLDVPYAGAPKGGIGTVGDSYPRGGNHPSENMEFIAHAPADVAALLAEVERLREVLEDITTDDEIAPGYIRRKARSALSGRPPQHSEEQDG